MKHQKKFKQTEIGEIPENKMREFKDEMEKFSYLRQNRVSYWQAIAIVFSTSAIILLTDLIVGENIVFKLILIVLMFLIANWSYRQSIKQTQKPIFVCDNAIGTVERMQNVKDKDGKEYSIFQMSDFIHKGKNNEATKKIQTN